MRKLLMLQPWSFSSTVVVLPWRHCSVLCQVHVRGFLHWSAIVGSVDSGLGRDEGHGWQQILDRSWLLPSAATKTTTVFGTDGVWGTGEAQGAGRFHVIRDDLLHPVMGGNKLRKLDAVIPLLQAHGVTDVVTCGGCQSAHTAAVAVACADVGMKAHLLLRGERPATPTGYNLIAGMYGYVSYIPRSEYSNRQAMLHKYAMQVAGGDPSCVFSLRNQLSTGRKIVGSEGEKGNQKRVAIVNEGAGDCHAMLGLIRLVDYLSQSSKFGKGERLRIIVDCGTGTTAVGLALGIALHRLPWQVVGVMLADTREGYANQADRLLSEFHQEYNSSHTWEVDFCVKGSDLPILWQERCQPRKFGRILANEVATCRQIARETGILLDPIYTLAGWDTASKLCQCCKGDNDGEVALLHTGMVGELFTAPVTCGPPRWLEALIAFLRDSLDYVIFALVLRTGKDASTATPLRASLLLAMPLGGRCLPIYLERRAPLREPSAQEFTEIRIPVYIHILNVTCSGNRMYFPDFESLFCGLIWTGAVG